MVESCTSAGHAGGPCTCNPACPAAVQISTTLGGNTVHGGDDVDGRGRKGRGWNGRDGEGEGKATEEGIEMRGRKDRSGN